MYESSFDHLDALLLESLVPLALLVGAQLFVSAQSLRKPGAKKAHVLSTWLAALFLILPVIARRVCQSFSCISYDAGTTDAGEDVFVEYLSADNSLDCTRPR